MISITWNNVDPDQRCDMESIGHKVSDGSKILEIYLHWDNENVNLLLRNTFSQIITLI